MGIANSRTTTIGKGVDAPEGSVWEGLRGLKVVVGLGIGVGIIYQHFEGVISSCEGGMVTLLPLEVAIVSDATGALVITMIGIMGGGGNIGVVINGCEGCTTCCWGVGVVDFKPAKRTSIRWATGDPSNVTSSYCIALAWSNSARLQMWFAKQIFWRAWRKRRNSIEQRKVKDQNQDEKLTWEVGIEGNTSVIKGTD